MRKIVLGIIGVGAMGRAHIKSLKLLDKIQIGAICDRYKPSLDEAAKLVSKKTLQFKNYQDLLSIKEIEAVIVATPNYTHSKVSIDALRAGKHILCENPH